MVSGISNTIAIKNNQSYSPAMRAQAVSAPEISLERSPETDTVEKKKKLSTAKKVGIGVAGTFIALIGTGLAVMAHQRNKIAKLYKEKLVLSNLGENIQFKEAANVEEGIKFAKEVLKIPEVDTNFTLEAINNTNKGLVDVSNANKGKLFMPRALRFEKPPEGEDWSACVIKDIKANNFGELYVNSSYFEHEYLDRGLKDMLFFSDGEKKYLKAQSGKMKSSYFINNLLSLPSDEAGKLIEKFYENPASLSIMEKLELAHGLKNKSNSANELNRNPLNFLKKLEKDQRLNSYFKDINYDELSKKTTKEQTEYAKDILKKMRDDKIYYGLPVDLGKQETVIYHEMGHLQDFAKNLKELDMAKWQLPNFKQTWEDAKSGKKTQERSAEINEIDNRWGSIDAHEEIKKQFEEQPEEFKKIYPELYEFLTNQETQQTAGKITAYAQSGIGEFIAEVYKNMISGKKIPEDVMALYKKYKGPELP